MTAVGRVGGVDSPATSRPDGILDVFLLALNIPDLPGGAADCAPRTEYAPFLPASAADPARATLPVRLVSVRGVDSPGPEIRLGTSSTAVYVGSPAACLSLWAVPGHGVVLAAETVTSADSGDSPKAVADWHAADIPTILDRFLAPFGLTADSCLREVFPDLDAAAPNPRLTEALAGAGHERASAALAVEVRGDGGEQVRRRTGWGGTDAAGWCWERLVLAARPTRDGAAVAVREDGGAVVFDLDAVPDDHEHDVFGVGEMIRALLPWVAVRARHAADYRLVLEHLRDHEALADGRLFVALDDVAAVQARRMERVLLVTEARHDGVALPRMSPTQLRTVLVRRISDEMAALDAELGEATGVVERALLRSAERRGRRHTRIAQAWSVAAGVIAVVAVFAALAAVPAVDQPTLFGHWLDALVVTIGLTVGVVAVAVLWRRP